MARICSSRSYSLVGLIVFLGLIGSSHPVPVGEPETKSVHVIFRHGDRAPDDNGHELYPMDPYLNYSFYPIGLAQLTNSGKRREFKLGQVLRNKFNDFLGDVYQPKDLFARSSDYDRTKMSLQLVLAGVYPPSPIQMWNENITWQPIPTTYVPRVQDNLIAPDECPLYLAEYDRVMKLPEVARMVNEYRDFMQNLTVRTGKNMTTLTDLYYLYHTLMAEQAVGLKLPSWADDIFPYGKLWNATVLWYETASYNDLLKKLYAGPILREIVNHMRSVVNDDENNNAKKLYLYSGHETNVGAMLKAFNIYEPHVPEYSSAVIVEHVELNGKHYVKIYHYMGIPSILNEVKLPECEKPCPMNKFLKLTSDLIPSDEELICDKTRTPTYSNTTSAARAHETMYNVIARHDNESMTIHR